MNNVIIFENQSYSYKIVVDFLSGKRHALAECKKNEYLRNENITEENIKYICINVNIFEALLELFGKKLKKNVTKKQLFSYKDLLLFKNLEGEKLIINEKNHEFMIKKFISNSNEIDYIILPDDIYDALVLALNKYYKKKEYNQDYFVTKETIFSIMNGNYNDFDFNGKLIERFDYFDIDCVKEKFIDFINNKINIADFNSFTSFISKLYKYHPYTRNPRKNMIYNMISGYCNCLDYIDDNDTAELSKRFAELKYLYNELNNINDGVKLYYNYSHTYNSGKGAAHVYEVVIQDNVNKEYWLGFITNPVFSFELNYRPYNEVVKLYPKDNNYYYDEYDEYDDYGLNVIGKVFKYLELNRNFKYVFNEELKNKYFK